jgi:adenylylsulfate kinase
MSFTLWFMGLPASGKSTLAKRVEHELSGQGYVVENLDGDELRKHLHPGLGFSREDRATNNRRTAYIAKLLNRNDIATIVAMITPFRESQQQAKEIVEEDGEFVLVYVKCPVDVCAERDPKGLYEQARAGKIDNFTGVNHPFQEPHDPDIIVDTKNTSVKQCVREVFAGLEDLDILDNEPQAEYAFDLTRDEEVEIESYLRDLGYID